MKRALSLATATMLALLGAFVAVLLSTAPVQAASQGSGFGTWAPLSRFGWHGSMMVDGVHTYCILPGLPAPTGASTDHGVRDDAAGLSSAQLTGINLLISKYGQTSDPAQAASVGWAVKAIANWNDTLHAFGYPGDTLAGAINWTFSALAPAENQRVQELATSYYTEATSAPTSVGSSTVEIALTTDADDPLRGSVTVTTPMVPVEGTIVLQNAVFDDTGAATRDDISPGVSYAITGLPEQPGLPFRIRAETTLTGDYRAAVRYFTTDGGQDTAGPAGRLRLSASTEDRNLRETTFAPVISTEVAARYVASGSFIDDVTFAPREGTWAQRDGAYTVVSAQATIYRTGLEPTLSATVPDDAESVGSLHLTSDPVQGPLVAQRVQSDWSLPGPGFYTAVWTIQATEQSPETAALLPDKYSWVEPFGEQSQIVMAPAITTQAQPVVAVGATMADDVVISAPVPRSGLNVIASVYQGPNDVDAQDACVPENLIWSNADNPVHVSQPETITITAPRVPDFGTYYWQEQVTDGEGRTVHVGACGIENETTTAPRPSVTTEATPSATTGALISDVAVVTGPVPQEGTTEITFELYHAAPGVKAELACTPDALFTTTDPVAVTRAGTYRSPDVRTTEAGTYYWIETLWYTPPQAAERLALAVGTCGLPKETSVVTDRDTSEALAITGIDATASVSPRGVGAAGVAACAMGLLILAVARGRFVARGESG